MNPGEASATARRFSNLLRLSSVGSTNALVAEGARAGTAEGLVVVADRQGAGRGRLDRRWVAPPEGALLCSVLMRPPLGPGELFGAVAVLSLAALSACQKLAPCSISLKWPNDLVADSGKVAGVLAEYVEASRGLPAAVVVGIGLNCYWPAGWPPEEERHEVEPLIAGATTLEQLSGVHVERDALLSALLDELEWRYDRLVADGTESLLVEYRSVCSTIGHEVRVETTGRHLRGIARDVSDVGALLLELEEGTVEVAAGDVVHLRAAGAPPPSGAVR